MFLPMFVCLFVCLSAKFLKSYERILIKFYGGVGRSQRKNALDYGIDSDPFSYFIPVFHPVMHFQWG